jgi:hypothetical protein
MTVIRCCVCHANPDLIRSPFKPDEDDEDKSSDDEA